ncbi:MAG: excinuclease ABC subunit UvrC [Clostridia bacterium]|nr:excinuclease ABC subunit UvrC [Clostridia bacterium]
MELRELRKKSMSLPLTPGVYLMKNKKNEIIYVGKAKKLKNRVSSYFGSQKNHPAKVRKMVENVCDFDYILTDSEFEALVLECSLIKQHSPKYNILLKDDKGYSYIRVTKGDWPQISAVLQKENDGADYIGPYTSSFSVRNSVNEARKIFMLPSCGKSFPKEIGKSRPCLNYFIKQCMAPCSGKVRQADYYEAVSEALRFLQGDSTEIIKDLKEKMNEAAESLDFEKAAKLRDRIRSIEKTAEKQKIVGADNRPKDFFAISQTEQKSCLCILRFETGRLRDSKYYFLPFFENLAQARSELISRFYSDGAKIPAQILLDGETEDAELLQEWLTKTAGRKVEILVPQKGKSAQTVQMCKNNAAEKLAQSLGRAGGITAALDELSKLLGLEKPPVFIESYDISHTMGSDNVAGMVVFKNGQPYKKSYRRFSIKGFSGQDDYGSMAEVISRRLNEYEIHKDSGEGFGILPDLILLDGGKGQVNAVKPIIDAFGYDIPVFGMVKDSSHRTRAIATNGGEIAINSKRQAFTLVSTIQEEVHRYSVAYHHTKHKSSSISTTLTEIDGVGEKKSKALLKKFRTLTAVKNASVEELCEAEGINKVIAQKIYNHFHKTD